jgi:hypothetical protein
VAIGGYLASGGLRDDRRPCLLRGPETWGDKVAARIIE